jgi:hypothetical protein
MATVPSDAEFDAALLNARRLFMGDADVQRALKQLGALLDQESIRYAIVGAMALNAYGYQRVTLDVDVLLTPEGLARFRAVGLGRGYLEKFPGSRGLRDTATSSPPITRDEGGCPVAQPCRRRSR